MRYDEPWSSRRPRGPRRYDEWSGFRGGYDRGFTGGPSRRTQRYPYDFGYRREATRGGAGERPPAYPPAHWGGAGPRARDYDRGYRARRGPGWGPGGYFRGGF